MFYFEQNRVQGQMIRITVMTKHATFDQRLYYHSIHMRDDMIIMSIRNSFGNNPRAINWPVFWITEISIPQSLVIGTHTTLIQHIHTNIIETPIEYRPAGMLGLFYFIITTVEPWLVLRTQPCQPCSRVREVYVCHTSLFPTHLDKQKKWHPKALHKKRHRWMKRTTFDIANRNV